MRCRETFGAGAAFATRATRDGSGSESWQRRAAEKTAARRSAESMSDEGSLDDLLLDEKERPVEETRLEEEARRRAEEKVVLSREGARAALITAPLLLFAFPAGVVAFVYFALKLGRRAFRAFYEPELRERFLREEVSQRVRKNVRAERQSLEVEHHRSLEQLSASIAHEIRNPITAAKSLVQQMGEDAVDVDQGEYARVAVAELERVERSISHLLRYAREEEARWDRVVMEDVLESAIETFRERAQRAGIEILRDYDAEGHLEGDAEQLRRVVINLLDNALDAVETSEGSRIRVSMGENLSGTEVWVRIADDGHGIDRDIRERIFEPLYTSREGGTGLGLALCRKIVDAHRGTIGVESAAGGGAEFVLTFPRRAEVSRSARSREEKA